MSANIKTLRPADLKAQEIIENLLDLARPTALLRPHMYWVIDEANQYLKDLKTESNSGFIERKEKD